MNSPEIPKKNWLQFAILALPFLIVAAGWSRFPARVPSHWNIRGHPDAWMNKGPGLLFLPIVNLGIWALFTALPRLSSNIRASQQAGRMEDVLRIWRLAFTSYVCFLSLLSMAAALGIPVSMDRMIVNGMLILFLIIGNFLGNLRPNKLTGIRTPWTLRDPEIWRATHRAGARILFYGCLALLAMQWFFSGVQLLIVSLGLLIGCSLWAIAYSYYLFRKKSHAAS